MSQGGAFGVPNSRTLPGRDAVAPQAGTFSRTRERLARIAVLAPIALVYLWCALVVRGSHSFSGDEPHYLAFTQGLWLYHTIDQHRVLYHHDFLAYYSHLMSSHSVHRGGHLYPLHYLGLPLVLLPGFALAGGAGAQVTVALIAVLLLWRTFAVAARVAGPLPAALAVGAVGLSAPMVLNAGTIYPDMLSGLLVVLAYEALDAPKLTARRALALGVTLAVCPWVHVKLLAIVAIFLAWAAYSSWRSARAGQSVVRPAIIAFGLPLVSLAGLMAYNLTVYGSPSPAAPYQGPTLFTADPWSGLLGQVFAQGQGALGTAPFLLLAFPGAVALWRCNRSAALQIGLATLPFWLVTLTYRDWWGGDAPPLRYLLPVLPLWSVGIAALIAQLRTGAARLAVATLALLTLALTATIPIAPRIGWPLANGRGALLLALGERLHLDLTSWLPAFEPTRAGPGLWNRPGLIALWAGVLITAWVLIVQRERRRSHNSSLSWRPRGGKLVS